MLICSFCYSRGSLVSDLILSHRTCCHLCNVFVVLLPVQFLFWVRYMLQHWSVVLFKAIIFVTNRVCYFWISDYFFQTHELHWGHCLQKLATYCLYFIVFFWGMMPHSSVSECWLSEGKCRLHLQNRATQPSVLQYKFTFMVNNYHIQCFVFF